MVIENDPSARIKVISLGNLQHPGHCAVCGNGNCEKGYVDLGVYFDYEGNVYLCVICATQIGEVVGLFTPEEVKSIQGIAERLASENETLKAELNHAKPIADAVFDLFNHRDVTGAASSLIVSSSSTDSGTAERSTQSVSGTDGGESGSQEPTLKSGRSRKTDAPKLRDVAFD